VPSAAQEACCSGGGPCTGSACRAVPSPKPTSALSRRCQVSHRAAHQHAHLVVGLGQVGLVKGGVVKGAGVVGGVAVAGAEDVAAAAGGKERRKRSSSVGCQEGNGGLISCLPGMGVRMAPPWRLGA
jgi:hypothetical protein